MADTVRLLSTKGRAQLIELFYFYDGETPIKDGIVEIPVDRPEWVQRAYIMGYRHDPVTEEVITLDEALAGGRKPVAPVEPESTESAGDETDEGTSTGGLAAGDDGLWEGEPARDESVPVEGLDGSDGDGVAVLEGGDDSTD